VLVLAADLPWVAPAVPALVDALPERGAALLVDTNGRPNYLAAAWRRRDLAAALEQLGDPHGLPVHALAARVEQVHVTDTAGWGRDCDTWDDLAEARSHEKDAR
jgi:CTP:molybdopterin cytidylyltransferase MocA